MHTSVCGDGGFSMFTREQSSTVLPSFDFAAIFSLVCHFYVLFSWTIFMKNEFDCSPLHIILEQGWWNSRETRIVCREWFVVIHKHSAKPFLWNSFVGVGGFLTNTQYFFHCSKGYFQFSPKQLACFCHVSQNSIFLRKTEILSVFAKGMNIV